MRSLVFLVILSLKVQAQDPVYTNTHQSLIALNPSFAGSNGLFRYQSTIRSQWFNLSGSYFTYYNSIDAYIKPIKGGIAISYIRDDQARGTLLTDRLDLTYAQHFRLFDEKLKIIPSVQFSYFKKTIDNTKLIFGDQIDPRRGFVGSTSDLPAKQSKNNLDVSAGLVVNNRHFYIGSSVFHITQPDEGIYGPSKLPYRFSVFTSYNLPLGEKVLLNAVVRYEKQFSFTSTNININALFAKHFIIGTGIINNHAVNTLVGYRHNYFTISSGYEFGISSISRRSGSFELHASFNLRNKDDRKSIKDFERW
ncbi:MAG: PorP/SprF family type IX secretion system membrane protein [Bacteroidota bacterium]